MPLIKDLVDVGFPARQAKIIAQQGGWCEVDETWVYDSAGVVRGLPALASSLYQTGDKIKFTQHGTTKYFYVDMGSFPLPDLYSIGLNAGSSYTLEDTATYPITNICISRVERPFGFPQWFNWTPTCTAGGSMTWTSVKIDYARFMMEGKRVEAHFYCNGTTGGTASNQLRVSLPVTSTTTNVVQGRSYTYDSAPSQGFINISVAGGGVYAACFKADSSNFGLGSTRIGSGFVSYEAAA